MHASTFARYAVPGRVVVQGFFDPMARAYRAADVVFCRAGAMTVAEVCAWGKASVLVPLPSAAADHQRYNARALADAGAAVLLPECDLSGRTAVVDGASTAATSGATRGDSPPRRASGGDRTRRRRLCQIF